MDLRSYIELKEAYKVLHSPENVDGEILDEALGTLGDALGNREDARKVSKAAVKPAKPGKASGAGALGTTGDALGGRMVPATPKSKPAPSSSASSSPEPKRAGTKSWADRLNSRRSSSAAAQANTNSKGQNVKTEPTTKPSSAPAAKATTTGSASSASGSTSMAKAAPAQKSAPAKPAPKPQSKDMGANMKSWAKANPNLAKKVKSGQSGYKAINPNAGKPKPTPGASAAMAAAKPSPKPMSRIAKATSNIKPLTNSVDMTDFDIILEHLMEQGFPQEEALKLMVNMSEEKRTQILEAGMHRDAKTGEVVDKAEVGKTYYPNMPKQKSSVALRKEKEAAEKKTQKEEMSSLHQAYLSMFDEETGDEYHARMAKKEMPWKKPNATKATTTPEVEKKLKDRAEKIKADKANRKPEAKKSDAEKMADATGPRKGSNYRGD